VICEILDDYGVAIRSCAHAGQTESECLLLFGTGFLGKPRAMFLLRIFRETTAETPVEITRLNSRSPFRHLSPSDVPNIVLIVILLLLFGSGLTVGLLTCR
jgi:hypothetical protein